MSGTKATSPARPFNTAVTIKKIVFPSPCLQLPTSAQMWPDVVYAQRDSSVESVMRRSIEVARAKYGPEPLQLILVLLPTKVCMDRQTPVLSNAYKGSACMVKVSSELNSQMSS